MTAPSRPNYRHSGARCCGTCAHRQIGYYGEYVCAYGTCPADPTNKETYDNWLRKNRDLSEVYMDFICDDYESEVEE